MHPVYTRSGTNYRDTRQETDARTAMAAIFAARTDVLLRGKRLSGHVPVPGELHAPNGDILTEERLSTEKINRNPVVYGIQEQDIKDGKYIYRRICRKTTEHCFQDIWL